MSYIGQPTLESLAYDLTERSVEYNEVPFELRAGGLSNWYVDLRAGLSQGAILRQTGSYIVEQADIEGFEYSVASAIGVGGHAVLSGAAANLMGREVTLSYAVDKHDIDEQGIDQYGLHAVVKDKKVWVLDDTTTSGNSLITLISMIRTEGGIVEEASVVADRSWGKVGLALKELGVSLHVLLEFSEDTGMLTPKEI